MNRIATLSNKTINYIWLQYAFLYKFEPKIDYIMEPMSSKWQLKMRVSIQK